VEPYAAPHYFSGQEQSLVTGKTFFLNAKWSQKTEKNYYGPVTVFETEPLSTQMGFLQKESARTVYFLNSLVFRRVVYGRTKTKL